MRQVIDRHDASLEFADVPGGTTGLLIKDKGKDADQPVYMRHTDILAATEPLQPLREPSPPSSALSFRPSSSPPSLRQPSLPCPSSHPSLPSLVLSSPLPPASQPNVS
jgi:hypothetical protein